VIEGAAVEGQSATDIRQNLTKALEFFDHHHREREYGACGGAGR
jgi:hypothetical protein